MSKRSVLAAIFLAIGLWYAVQTFLFAVLLLTWSGDGTPPSEAWTWVAVQGVVAAACLVVASRWARKTADGPETSSGLASSPWDLARYLMGLYALYRAVLALGTVIGEMLGDRRSIATYDLGGPLPVTAIVECAVATIFGVVLLVGPGRIAGAFRRRSAAGGAGGAVA